MEELKASVKMVDNFITEENVNGHFEWDHITKKIESQLIIFYNV